MNKEEIKNEFNTFWSNLEDEEGHQRSPSCKNSRKAYTAGRLKSAKVSEAKRLEALNSLDTIIENSHNLLTISNEVLSIRKFIESLKSEGV